MLLIFPRLDFDFSRQRKAVATLLLWLSFVVLCDPHPSSHVPAGNHLASQLSTREKSYGPAKLVNNTSVLATQKSHPSPRTFEPSSFHSRNGITSPNPNVSSSSSPLSTITRLPQDSYTTRKGLTFLNSGLHTEKGEPSSLYDLEEESKERRDFSKLVLKLDRDYTPQEIADYIFSTGDEKGISQVIGDMIQDGQIMTNKEDVIHFLEVVQEELAKMRNQFHTSVRNSWGNKYITTDRTISHNPPPTKVIQ